MMPYRDRSTVESWVSEFVLARSTGDFHVAVLDKNFQAGPNSGLVVVTLRSAGTITYLHPEVRRGVPRWVVTFEPRSDTLDLDAKAVEQLAEDIAGVAELCAFLQLKTDAAVLAH